MKYLLLLSLQLLFLVNLFSQTVKTNTEIQIGQSTDPISEAGAIRWNGTDFEGFTGTKWVSLTKTDKSVVSNSFSSDIWGKAILSAYEDQSAVAPDAAHSDHFAYSVDIDGDVAVVSSHGDDDNGVDSGSAYIFERENDLWVFKGKLLPSDGSAGRWFGFSVGISGETVVVGDYRANGYTGRIYVFSRPANGWTNMTQTAILTPSDLTNGDHFGFSVAIEGDVIIAGSPRDHANAYQSGSAYIFEKPNGGWVDGVNVAKLTASDANSQDELGISVAISNGDAVVGAYLRDESHVNSGAAYVFEKSASGWETTTEIAKIKASDPAAIDQFGNSVAIDSNLIAVGVPLDDSGMGAVYVYEKDTSGWIDATETIKMVAGDRAQNDHFGQSVGIGSGVIVIGCPDQDNNDLGENGAVYLYKWNEINNLNPISGFQLIGSNLLTGSRSGLDVAIDGDVILSGAYYANSISGNTGKALFYYIK